MSEHARLILKRLMMRGRRPDMAMQFFHATENQRSQLKSLYRRLCLKHQMQLILCPFLYVR